MGPTVGEFLDKIPHKFSYKGRSRDALLVEGLMQQLVSGGPGDHWPQRFVFGVVSE